MAKKIWQAYIQDPRGSVVPNASVRVTSGGRNAVIYADAAGTPKSNPFTASAQGFAFFFADEGEYEITANTASFSATESGVEIGAPGKVIAADLASTADSEKGAALVGFKSISAGAVGRLLPAKLSERVSVHDFGAIGDGVADDTVALQAAAATGKPVYLAGAVLHVTASVTLIADLIGPGEIKGASLLAIGDDNVTIFGVTLRGTTASGTKADVAIEAINRSGLWVEGCEIINARTRVRNTSMAEIRNFRFINNRVIANFTNFDYMVTQNDVVTVRGINGVWITGNSVDVINCHRIFKLADTEAAPATSVSAYRTRNVFITGNRIAGSTGSGKQVMDLYTGTSDIEIADNTVVVAGFGVVIENKTGIATDFQQNTNIHDNLLSNDKVVINLQGSHGALTAGHDSGFQNARLRGNTFVRTGSGASPLVSVRFYHDLLVDGNKFVTPSGMVDHWALEVLPCKHAIISSNGITYGAIYSTDAVKNTAGDSYNADVLSLKFIGNRVDDFGGANMLGGIFINQTAKAKAVVDISSNTVLQTVNGAASAGAIAVCNAALKKLVVNGNVADMAGSVEHRLRLTGHSIPALVETGNSWNLLTGSATYTPPPLTDGAGDTAVVTVKGAVPGDFVRASFSRALAGITMTAWVSAADTVSVQFRNGSGRTLDLASGTLNVRVERYAV